MCLDTDSGMCSRVWACRFELGYSGQQPSATWPKEEKKKRLDYREENKKRRRHEK